MSTIALVKITWRNFGTVKSNCAIPGDRKMLPLLGLFLCAAAQPEPFEAPGFDVPVAGAWYEPGKASSAMPLGVLGTGFVDFTSRATFAASTAENNWLRPQPVGAASGLTIRVGEKGVGLFPDAEAAPASMRFWGHYPAADVDFGDTFGDVAVYLRAYAPLVPHDYELSNMPVALFHFTVTNRESEAAPVEFGLQWQAALESSTESRGNVEGALGWRRSTLASGDTWTIVPKLVFSPSRDELAARVRQAQTIAGVIEGADAPEGKAYAFGEVSDFFLDAFGGFNWEAHRRESARFAGAPNIGQVFWRLSYGDKQAGRGMNGPYGMSGDALPARTADGAIEVRLTLSRAGTDGAALAFAFTNVSGKQLNDLRFGLAVNVDIGGPGSSENQRAKLDKNINGIVFEDKDLDTAIALAGDAGDYIVSTWLDAHGKMEAGEWTPIDAPENAPVVETISNGLKIVLPSGSYAVAGAGRDGWSLQSVRQGADVIRAQARRTLAPGETAETTLALSWHFPYWTSSDRERLRHRYAASYADAGEVMVAALPRADEIERKIIAWQQAIYASDVPPLLKDAVVNGLYILPRNSWWIADGRFFQSESFTGCPITETFVCRFNGSFPLALLFPECERATMRAVAGAQAESGEIPFGFGRPTASRSPYFQVQHPIVSSEFVLTTWRNFVLWNDDAYLDEMFPNVQAALRYAMTLDKDGDGLVNEDPGSETGFPANQYYDIWPWWGTSAYTAGIWLAALRAGEEMAKNVGDQTFAQELRGWYERGGQAFEEKLWTGTYYRLYNDPKGKRISETSLTNALCGQWFAYTCGLGDIVPRANTDSVIDTVLRLNVPATKYGAVNGVGPDGSVDETFPNHSAVITIGEVWNFCAMAAFAGRKEDAVRLFNTSYENVLLRQRTPWNIPWSLDRNTGAIKWGINYYSNPCIWTLFQALDPKTYARLGKQ